MFKGKKAFLKNAVINDWILRSKSSSGGFVVLCVHQSLFKRYLHQTQTPEYPDVEELALPSNIGDLASTEKLKFSSKRNREINGSYIKFFSSPITKYKDSSPKIQDERVQCYDCPATINLSSAMQTNVPFPFRSRGKPTHFIMPGVQWAQNEKYTSQDLNNLHHSNYKHLTINGGTFKFGFKNTARHSFLCLSAMGELGLRTCDCLDFNFNIFSCQSRSYCSQKGRVDNVDVSSDKKIETNDLSPMSKKEKLKLAIRDYGSAILVFHIGISLISLGCCYCLVASGVDMSAIFKDWGVQEGATAAGTAAQFIVAYAVHKSTAPARIALTLSAAPFVVKKLRKIGLFKSSRVKIQ